MVYNFRDIFNENMYNKSNVLFVTGQYPVFNDIVLDKLKEYHKGSADMNIKNTGILKEFGYESGEAEYLNRVSFDDFMKVVVNPPLYGKWFCSVYMGELSKKQREKLDTYYKNGSNNGILVVNILEYRDYKKYLRDRTLKNSETSSMIKLSYPDRGTLGKIISDILGEGIIIDKKAKALFILRMSTEYNSYRDVLSDIKSKYDGGSISYKDMLIELRGIANYTIDDFVLRLHKPIEKNVVSKRIKIYSMEKALVSEYGYRGLLKRLKSKIKSLIEIRLLMNSGIIPVGIKYNVKRIKNSLPDNNSLKKMSEYTFEKESRVAERFAIRDLVMIELMLNSVDSAATEQECARVLHSVINRTTFDKRRLLNDINIINDIDEELLYINKA